jgi:hypothetical protein
MEEKLNLRELSTDASSDLLEGGVEENKGEVAGFKKSRDLQIKIL